MGLEKDKGTGILGQAVSRIIVLLLKDPGGLRISLARANPLSTIELGKRRKRKLLSGILSGRKKSRRGPERISLKGKTRREKVGKGGRRRRERRRKRRSSILVKTFWIWTMMISSLMGRLRMSQVEKHL